MPTSAPNPRCTALPILVGLTLLAALIPDPAEAHLSILRQGPESRGAYEAGDRYGESLAAGDFNGDGIEDLAIGSPDEDVGSIAQAGAVIIVWGTPVGLDPAGAMIWTEADITGASATQGGEFGYALAAADFDHDGYDDLAVGCPGADLAGPDTGMVYLLQGTSGGLAKFADLTQADGGAAVEAGDRFGASLAAGNFDGDGEPYVDLAVGSPGENGNSGAVFWFLSNALGPLGPSGLFVQSDFGQSDTAGDRFGFSLAAGNFISGTHDDLAVGAPFKNVSGQNDAGVVYQIPGTNAGLAVGGYAVLSALSAGLPEANARYGYALAVGRMRPTTGDYESLAVGEPRRTVGGHQVAGRVIVYAGGLGGVITTTEIILDQDDAGGVVAPFDTFGMALAAGPFWQDDGWDDLAVGSPNDGLGFTTGAGQINIFPGGSSGPGSHGWSGFNQGTLNDPATGGDALGFAPVYGKFDSTGHGHLAVGAPGDANDAGMVHVIAPWRQAYGLGSKQSVVYDCADRLMFSQKPYDQVLIASTTKIMTVLIGCERLQAGLIDPNDEYVVPNWVATQIGGSQVPLYTGERIDFWDMLNVCLHLSGNDAAHALADWMAVGAGGADPALSVPLFVNEMNQRAAQIGMTGTHFNNPNGFEQEVVTGDLGDHYSTPVDMARLSQVAMDNPLFSEIARKTSYSMIRQIPAGPPGVYFEMPWSFPTFFSGIIQNNAQPATGIKGGWTPAAKITGCFSAESPLGTPWVAGTYGTPDIEGSNAYMNDAANLLKLGGESATCGVFLGFAENFVPFYPSWTNIDVSADVLTGGATEIGWADAGDLELHVEAWTGADGLQAQLEVQHVVEVELGPGEEVPLGSAPFDGHHGITLLNMGAVDATLEVHQSGVADAEVVELVPGEPQVVSPLTVARRQGRFDLLLLNLSPTDDAHLTVEIVYPIAVEFPAGVPPELDLQLFRPEGVPLRDSISFEVQGQSVSANSALAMSVRPAGSSATAIPDVGPTSTPGSILELRPAYPNPSGGERTLIRFDLHRQARVEVAIFDVRGRRVRSLSERSLLAGRHRMTWDGRDRQGRPVADGVYYYRVVADGHPPQAGKLSVVR